MFVEESFRSGYIKESGKSVDEILPPISFFGSPIGEDRMAIKQRVMERLIAFFDRYFGI